LTDTQTNAASHEAAIVTERRAPRSFSEAKEMLAARDAEFDDVVRRFSIAQEAARAQYKLAEERLGHIADLRRQVERLTATADEAIATGRRATDELAKARERNDELHRALERWMGFVDALRNDSRPGGVARRFGGSLGEAPVMVGPGPLDWGDSFQAIKKVAKMASEDALRDRAEKAR
jgi:hypothetical protein